MYTHEATGKVEVEYREARAGEEIGEGGLGGCRKKIKHR